MLIEVNVAVTLYQNQVELKLCKSYRFGTK